MQDLTFSAHIRKYFLEESTHTYIICNSRAHLFLGRKETELWNLVTEASGRFAKNLQVILESSPAHRHYVQNHLQVILESSPAHGR
jgi:hypothetical protein